MEATIEELYREDRADRIAYAKESNQDQGLEIRKRDEQRLEQARGILASREVTDPNELNMLAYIFQHGDNLDNYRRALQLTTQAVKLGLPPQDSLVCHATDRLMIRQQLDNGVPLNQLKQKYGTQTLFDQEGKPFIPPLDGTATEEELDRFGIDKL